MQDSFWDRIQEEREHELGTLWKSFVVGALNSFLLNSLPVLVAVATFGTYILMGNNITASQAFTALSLLNVRQPCCYHPVLLSCHLHYHICHRCCVRRTCSSATSNRMLAIACCADELWPCRATPGRLHERLLLVSSGLQVLFVGIIAWLCRLLDSHAGLAWPASSKMLAWHVPGYHWSVDHEHINATRVLKIGVYPAIYYILSLLAIRHLN